MTNVVGAAPLTITALPVGDREITWPSTVIAPPAVRVCDPMTKSDCAFSVKVEEPTATIGIEVTVGVGVGGEFDNGRVITSPLVVMAPPGVSVCEPITNWEAELAVMVDPPMTTTAAGERLADDDCEDVEAALMITALPEEAKETCSPLTVTTEPGDRVCEPIIKLDEES